MGEDVNNRKLVKKMRDRGWIVGQTKKGHLKFTHTESGRSLIYPGSASCSRAEKNHWASVKKIEEGRFSAL